MKRRIVAGAVSALLFSVSAYADVIVGASLKAMVTPVAYDGDNVVGLAEKNDGGFRTSRFDFKITSEDEKAGVVTGLVWQDDTWKSPADSYLWIKPVDKLKLAAGKRDLTKMRGDLTFGSWNWIRPKWIGDEGLTMTTTSGTGFFAEFTPVDSFYFRAFVPLEATAKNAEDVYGKAGVGYELNIDKVGKFKVQWVGKYLHDITEVKEYSLDTTTGKTKSKVVKTKGTGDWYYGDIEAAFDFKAVENLFFTVGGKVAIMEDDYVGDRAKVALGASYKILSRVKVSASGAAFIHNTENTNATGSEKISFQGGAGVDFKVADALSINTDVRLNKKANVDDPSLSFLAGVVYSVGSNAELGLGFEGVVKGDLYGISPAKDSDFIFAIPLRMNVKI